MTTLERRLDRLESVALPEDEMLYCFLDEEEDGTLLPFMKPNRRCPHHLVQPVKEFCDQCKAHKIIFQFVGGRED